MGVPHSPLRYPGGKQILARVLGYLIRTNGREGGIYVEPYAGGAGAALTLLFAEYVQRVMLNDADASIYAFWHSILNNTERFVKLLHDVPLTTAEWRRQREIYLRPTDHGGLELGFATFYLNRCNRSGIIGSGGVIGGLKQRGRWKLDARFNKRDLVRRIQRIARYRDRIGLFNSDAVEFLKNHVVSPSVVPNAFVYLDPPYYGKGRKLYLNFYEPEDHRTLASYIVRQKSLLWLVSYDDVGEVRQLYSGLRQARLELGYSARSRRVGKEILIASKSLKFPEQWESRVPSEYVSAADDIEISAVG